MKIVIDIGETQADAVAILQAMDGDELELVGTDDSHVGCRIYGVLNEGGFFSTVVPLNETSAP
jgi:hypothetical protein